MMKAMALTVFLAALGLAGCASPPPPQPVYQAAPEPTAEYPHVRTHHYSEPAS